MNGETGLPHSIFEKADFGSQQGLGLYYTQDSDYQLRFLINKKGKFFLSVDLGVKLRFEFTIKICLKLEFCLHYS